MLNKLKEFIMSAFSSDKDEADSANRLLSVIALSLVIMTFTGVFVILN